MKKRNTKFNKILSLFLLAIAGTMLFVAVFQYIFKYYLQQVDNQYYIAHTETIAKGLERIFVERGYSNIRQWHEYRRNHPKRIIKSKEKIFVIDKNGLIIFHTDISKEGTLGKIKTNFEKINVSHRYLKNINRELYTVTIPLKINKETQSLLCAKYFQSPKNKFSYIVFKKVKNLLFFIATILFFIITVLIMIITFSFLKEWITSSNIKIENEKQLALIGVGIAHEVKNSLNGIAMNAQLLQSSMEQLPFEKKEKFLKKTIRIQKESERTGLMLNEFLSYAKPNKFSPLPVNIFAMLEDISKFFEAECLARNINLKFECSKELTSVLADELQLRHCISNLLWNAVNAVKKDGQISLKGEFIKNKTVIKVIDSGGGMDVESEKRAFEVFYSTQPQGAGLGLSIAQRVAKSHNGKLTFENKKGEGCTFILSF